MYFEQIINTSTKKGVLANLLKNRYSTRVKLAHEVGVTTANLTKVSKELIEHGILTDNGEIETGKVGRRQKKLTIVPDAFYSVGLEVGLTETRLVIINAKLDIIYEKEWFYDVLEEEVLDSIVDNIKDFCSNIECSNILGVGLLIPGAIQHGTPAYIPIRDIKQKLESALGLEVVMWNNIRGLATVESFFESGADNFLLVKYGPGVGGVISIDGNVLEGKHNRAGEIGHVQWNPQSEHTCPRCHKRGCLESEIHFRNLDSSIPYTNENNSVEAKKEIIVKNKDVILAYIEELGKAIAFAIELLDPASLIIAGLVFTNDEMYNHLVEVVTSLNSTLDKDAIRRIDNYEEKASKAAAMIVIAEKLK